MTTEMRAAPDPTGAPERLEPDAWRTSSLPSPGARLRQAREARGLSQPDVSARLHLTPQLVDALECDDLEQGPGPMYMRGYLRSYARLLEIPAEEILATMPGRNEPAHWASISTASPPPKARPQARMSDWPVRWVTYAIGALLVGLTLVWLWGRSGDDESPALSVPSLTSPAEQSLALPQPVPAKPEAPAEVAPAAPAPVAAAEPVAVPEPEPVAIPAPAPVPVRAEPARAEPAPVVAAAAGGSTLRMQFNDACWVRVANSAGKVIKNTTAKAGDTLEFGEGAPFSVVLGNAPSVSVEYAGAPFDTAPFTRNAIARFTVGAAE